MFQLKSLKNILSIQFFISSYYAVAHLSYFDDATRHNYMSITLILSILFCIIKLFKNKLLIHKSNRYIMIIYLCVVTYAMLINIIFPPGTEYGIVKYKYFILTFTVSFLIIPIFLDNGDDFVILSKFICFYSVLYCLIGILSPSGGFSNIRANEISLNPAMMGKMCMLSSVYVLSVMFVGKLKPYHYVILLISIFATLKTGTRGPILSLAITYVVLFLFSGKKVSKLLKIILFSGILVIFLFFAMKYINPEILERFSFENFSFESHSDEGDRLDLFTTALSIIKERPLGIGFGNFALFHRFIIAPHNLFLEFSAELGLLFGVFFFFLCVQAIIIIHQEIHKKNESIYFAGGLFIFQLSNSMLGGEMTMQSFLIYLSLSFLLKYRYQYSSVRLGH